jgi:hypothetical protein
VPISTATDIITLRAPALAIAYAARIPDLILLATQQTGDIFGTQKQTAIAYLVLHWLALEQRGASGAPGPITNEAEGDLSRGYGTSGTGISGDLGSTSWGLELKRLRDSTIFAARNRMMPGL